jgi:acyl transferase domain-containing protein/NAD(P)H-dependent flavin oxidoreductase YrpB (nitropropane dioxygenase family)/NAD(P)-dependent dehydrogenase (short-subunit alcohol dehydrogenase family)
MADFYICSLSMPPLERAAPPAVALATLRAGGVGILDLETALHSDSSFARRCVITLLRGCDSQSSRPSRELPIGFRFPASRMAEFQAIADAAGLAAKNHWCLVSDWERCTALPALAANRKVWLEISSRNDIKRARGLGLKPDGWLARGSECGGIAGAESIFVLAQALARQDLPFLLQGGLGLRGCVACRVAGAAGAILDDALLLMAESPLRELCGSALRRMGAEDTIRLGEEFGMSVRIPDRPDLPAARALKEFAESLIAAEGTAEEHAQQWETEVRSRLGWGDPRRFAWPLGQGFGLAAIYEARFRTTGRLIQAALDAVSDKSLESIAAASLLAPGSPLAVSHGTRYPVVQGPMTRVSDTPQFADAVSKAGALPLLALAMFRGPESRALLEACAAKLEGRSWGAGILGFVAKELLDEQMEAVAQVRPPFALIAGGRPGQIRALEDQGTAAYLHTPTPALLRTFLAQGVRRFVFEGGECGGHTGPLHSLPLWEAAVEALLEAIPSEPAESVHVLFAGGIHDALSAAMAAALAAPLASRGVRIGVLVGTGYLFTEEAVACGAIVPQFQQQAISCDAVVRLHTGPGHTIHCANTPFTGSFEQTRQRFYREGVPSREVTARLEELMLGRSRVAAKGNGRDSNGGLRALDGEEQLRDGVYMMGQVAALRESIGTVAALHRDLSEGSTALVRERFLRADSRRHATVRSAEVPIAIVGASCLLPGAQSPAAFWKNVLAKASFVREIPIGRFDWRLYFDADRNAPDRIYSKWGAFLDKLPFDPERFGIPPHSLRSISAVQLLTLEACRRALDDAGFGSENFDRENTAVILGTDGMADLYHGYIARALLPSILSSPLRGPLAEVYSRLPSWTEESFPGILSNVAAGRVANRLDLRGPNYSVDAACASSLAALQLGVRELERGDSNVAIVIGAEFDQNPYGYLAFSKTRALSPTGQARPFDRNADGIVIGEGVVVLVLRRLSDAERDGDRIYAVIRSVAGSSDGKAMSLTAPRTEGQQLALRRAYDRAELSPASIGMYEAHGTGTVVGDKAELNTVSSALASAGANPGQCVLGSTKGLIGHTKAAAGLAGVLKASLALYHRTLPPHAPVEAPLADLADPRSPMRILDQAQPWLEPEDGPRRAGVSAFGFGGTNFHAVLEEYAGPLSAPAPGGDEWPAEIFLLCAPDSAGLLDQLHSLRRAAQLDPELRLRDLACSVCPEAGSAGTRRLAFVASDLAELDRAIEDAAARIRAGETGKRDGLSYGCEELTGTLAFLFPGQGSQYPGMGAELAVYLPEVRKAFESMGLFSQPVARQVRECLLPPKVFDDQARQALARRMQATETAQPALGVLEAGLLAFIERMGVRPAAVAGHSYGEFAALYSGGAISREAFLTLSEARGNAMAAAAQTTPGAMAAVDCSRGEMGELLRQLPGITLTNHNAPRQCVIAGAEEAIENALAELARRRIASRRLHVGAAFHSPAMAPAAISVKTAILAAEFSAPQVPVFSNITAAQYPASAEPARDLLCRHLESPVEFVAQIENLYASGARVFVEVGPKQVLSGLVSRILEGRPHLAVPLDNGAGRLQTLLEAIGQLFACGVALDAAALFAGRPVRKLPLNEIAAPSAPRWFIDGGSIWPASEAHGHIGEEPLLTLETSATAEPPDAARTDVPSSALQAFGEYQQTMRSFLETQERALERFLNGLDGHPSLIQPLSSHSPTPLPAGESTARLIAPPPAQSGSEMPLAATANGAPEEAEPDEAEMTLAGVSSMFIRLIAERTGYAPASIRPELDLEAELGVDSIKRIEVLAKAEDHLPPSIRESFRLATDRLTQTRSVDALARAVLAMAASAAEPPASAAHPPAGSGGCQRLVMRSYAAPLVEEPRGGLRGLYLVTGGRSLAVDAVCAQIRSRGGDAGWIDIEALAEPQRLRTAVDVCIRRYGPATGIVHLAPLDLSDAEPSLAAWQSHTRLCVESLFDLLQQCGEASPTLLAATALGGNWGRDAAGPGLPQAAAGGVHGIARSYAAESGVIAKVVDFEPGAEGKFVASSLITELLSGDSTYSEIGYLRGERLVFLPEIENLARENDVAWRPEAGSVVLVTGGARGITAIAAEALAVAGAHFVLVGRDEIDESTPGGREKKRNLEKLRALGVAAEYRTADVGSEAAFGSLIDGLYARFGRIDAVIHGAGVIEDKLLASKSIESFRRVFATKAGSAFLLRTRLRPEHLKLVVLFASVSGRFGNPGQADYAAGNEILNRMAWNMSAAWPETRVVSINWGPWRESGMASSAALRRLEARGIQTISTAEGKQFFVDEIGLGRDVEVVAGAGPWMISPPALNEMAALPGD